MTGTLELEGWVAKRVAPIGDDWIEIDWANLVSQLIQKGLNKCHDFNQIYTRKSRKSVETTPITRERKTIWKQRLMRMLIFCICDNNSDYFAYRIIQHI